MDDVLCIHKDPDKHLNLVERDFRLKDPLECPAIYLVADISKFEIPNDENGVTFWAISSDIHVNKALQVLEAKLKYYNIRWKPSNKITDHPFSSQSYCFDIDMTEECNDDQVQFYQSLVVIMRWLCEIEISDILT